MLCDIWVDQRRGSFKQEETWRCVRGENKCGLAQDAQGRLARVSHMSPHGSPGVLHRDAWGVRSYEQEWSLASWWGFWLWGDPILSALQGQICAGQPGETWSDFGFALIFRLYIFSMIIQLFLMEVVCGFSSSTNSEIILLLLFLCVCVCVCSFNCLPQFNLPLESINVWMSWVCFCAGTDLEKQSGL